MQPPIESHESSEPSGLGAFQGLGQLADPQNVSGSFHMLRSLAINTKGNDGFHGSRLPRRLSLSVQIAPFTADHLEDAARLLATRHRRDREWIPILSREYEEATATLPMLQELFAEDGVSGVVWLDDGRVSGYLLATPVLGVPTRAFTGFMSPRSVDIQQHGHATIPGCEATLFPRLYAAMAARWLRDGLVGHYITCPAHATASHGGSSDLASS